MNHPRSSDRAPRLVLEGSLCRATLEIAAHGFSGARHIVIEVVKVISDDASRFRLQYVRPGVERLVSETPGSHRAHEWVIRIVRGVEALQLVSEPKPSTAPTRLAHECPECGEEAEHRLAAFGRRWYFECERCGSNFNAVVFSPLRVWTQRRSRSTDEGRRDVEVCGSDPDSRLECVCARCFLSPDIAAWIMRTGTLGSEICAYCGWKGSPTVPARDIAGLLTVALREKLTVRNVKEMELDVIVAAMEDLAAPTVSRRDLLVRDVLGL